MVIVVWKNYLIFPQNSTKFPKVNIYYAIFISTVHLQPYLRVWIVILPIDCNFWCDMKDKPVCEHDWKTYSNECFMRREACRRREAIIKVYDGGCKGGIFAIQTGRSILCWLFRYRSSHHRCSMEKGVLTNFAKFTGKQLC